VKAVRTVPKPNRDERQSFHDAPRANRPRSFDEFRGVVFTAAALEDGCDRLVVQLSPHSPPLVQDAEF